MGLTLAKFNATKNVPGAWPENPLTSPTLLMMVVSIVNCLVDSVNLLFQCCGAAALGVMTGIASKVHKATGVVMALAPAAAVGFSGISTTTSNNTDLWSWSCSSGADKMANVNSSGTICMTNVKSRFLLTRIPLHIMYERNLTSFGYAMQQTAFALQVCQIIFHILSLLIPALADYRPSSPSSKGSNSAKDEKAAAAKSGDEAAQKLINEATKTFQSIGHP